MKIKKNNSHKGQNSGVDGPQGMHTLRPDLFYLVPEEILIPTCALNHSSSYFSKIQMFQCPSNCTKNSKWWNDTIHGQIGTNISFIAWLEIPVRTIRNCALSTCKCIKSMCMHTHKLTHCPYTHISLYTP